MNVELVPAGRDDEARLAALWQLYVYDLSALFGFDVDADARFAHRPLDAYFGEPRRHAFLIRADEQLAGFALVDGKSRLTGDPTVWDMAEFFVLQRYRRRGVGERAAVSLFGRFAGTWEVRQRRVNEPATAFWRRIIGRYSGGRFEDLVLDDERHRGPAQRFISGR
ncbi:MAG TPA: GNAT family N-acetyltransferase [Polyangia bacterium]|nr:GNAT family N-acetyltransferase [Polyangia bacterium]